MNRKVSKGHKQAIYRKRNTNLVIFSASLREMQIKTTLSNYFSPARPVKIQKPNNIYTLPARPWRRGTFQTVLVDMQNGTNPQEGQFGDSNQSYNCTDSWPSNPTYGNLLSRYTCNRYTIMHVQGYSSQDLYHSKTGNNSSCHPQGTGYTSSIYTTEGVRKE